MIDEGIVARRLVELSVEYLRVFSKESLLVCHFSGILKVLNAILELDVTINSQFSEKIGEMCENLLINLNDKECILEKIEIIRVLEKLKKIQVYSFQDIFNFQLANGSWKNSWRINDFVYTMQIVEELEHISDIRIEPYREQIQLAHLFIEEIWREDLKKKNFIPFKAGKFILANIHSTFESMCMEESVLGLLETQMECGGWSYFRKDKRNKDFLEYQCSMIDTMEILISLLDYREKFHVEPYLMQNIERAINNAFLYVFSEFKEHGWKSQDNFQYARTLSLGMKIYQKAGKFNFIQEKICSV